MTHLPVFKGTYAYPLGNNKYWRRVADSNPTSMDKEDWWFDWWVYRHISNDAEFLVMVQSGAAADIQETQNFLRDFMSRAAAIGVTFGPTGGGRPDYLNDPAKMIVYFNGRADQLANILRKVSHFYQQGLEDMSNAIADRLKESLG